MAQAGKCGAVRIGISGWRYAGWRGVFYPPGLQQRRELQYASRIFPSIEINGTFYSLQRPEHFAAWAAETPDNFLFSLKGSRFITHMKKLRDIEEALANFFAQGMLRLGPKLGPVLWQFPANFAFNPERFEYFFRLLPRTMGDAAMLAQAHSPRLHGRAWTEIDPAVKPKHPLRHCIEIRHESFSTPECMALLRRHNIGLVVADTVEWPLLFDLTSDFVYCRLHGSEKLYVSGYDEVQLDLWADRVATWARGCHLSEGRYACSRRPRKARRDVYVYFDNDAKVRAPFDAQGLMQRIAARLSYPASAAE